MPPPLCSLQTANTFLHIPKCLSSATNDGSSIQQPPLIFFITGNPGLIQYYHDFLGLLCDNSNLADGPAEVLQANESTRQTAARTPSSHDCVVAGFSLGGFEIRDESAAARNQSAGSSSGGYSDDTAELARQLFYPSARSSELEPVPEEQKSIDGSLHSATTPGVRKSKDPKRTSAASTTATSTREHGAEKKEKKLYSLRDQIDLCHARVTQLVSRLRSQWPTVFTRPVEVIIVGHSVGTYIALELVRIHHSETSRTTTTARPVAAEADGDGNARTSAIRACVLLTPTVVDLAKSPSGRVAGPVLSYVPGLTGLLQSCVNGLAGPWVPRAWLTGVVGRVTGMTGRNLRTTVEFLATDGCVRQALEMARDELVEIREDRWGEEVWGVVDLEHQNGEEKSESREKWRSPSLYFWFARRDHWVADETREEIVKARGNTNTSAGSRMVVDEAGGLMHAWCLEQSEMVAEKVRGWIEEIRNSRT